MRSKLLLALMLALPVAAPADDPPPVPASMLMPGATPAVVCVPGYASRVRHVTSAQKKAVCGGKADCIVDHVISLEIGGSNDSSNLAAQTKAAAAEKDKLENDLHKQLCDPKHPVPLNVVQWAIWSEWGHREGKW